MMTRTINALARYLYREAETLDKEHPNRRPIKRTYLVVVFAIMVGLMYVDALRRALRWRGWRRWRKPTQAEVDEFGLPVSRDREQ